MKQSFRPFSLKLIYWLYETAFWAMVLATAACLAFAIALNLGADLPENLNISLSTPIKFELEKVGILETDDGPIDVKLSGLKGQMKMEQPHKPLASRTLWFVFVQLILLLIPMYFFRKFLLQVYRQAYFSEYNKQLLEKLAISVLFYWIVTGISGWIYSISLMEKIEFEGLLVEQGPTLKIGFAPAFVALLIWVLAHIFQKGMQLEEEQKLTV